MKKALPVRKRGRCGNSLRFGANGMHLGVMKTNQKQRDASSLNFVVLKALRVFVDSDTGAEAREGSEMTEADRIAARTHKCLYCGRKLKPIAYANKRSAIIRHRMPRHFISAFGGPEVCWGSYQSVANYDQVRRIFEGDLSAEARERDEAMTTLCRSYED